MLRTTLLQVLLISLAAQSPAIAQEAPAKRPITFDAVYGPAATLRPYRTSAPQFEWLPDGSGLLRLGNGTPDKLDPATGVWSPLFDPQTVTQALQTIPEIDADTAAGLARQPHPQFTPAYDGILLRHESHFCFVKLDGSFACRLPGVSENDELITFSPDGQTLAFVRDNDLYVVDIATQHQQRLTSDGSNLIRNGKADWVYWEEVFDRNSQAFWFNGNGSQIVFLQFDDAPVTTFVIPNDVPATQTVREMRYPKAGTANPLVKVGIAVVADASVRWVDLAEYPPDDRLVVRAGWQPDNETAFLYLQNRTQTWLDFLVVPPHENVPRRLLRETTEAWVNNLAPPHFLADGSFLWESERTGWRHLYRYDAQGECLGPVTAGSWEISQVHHVDEQAGTLFFTGTMHSPLEDHLYRVSVDGGEPVQLTSAGHTHRIRMSSAGDRILDTHSSIEHPPTIELCGADGQSIQHLYQTDMTDWDDFAWGSNRSVTIETRDGDTLNGHLLFPTDFDSTRQYPVWLRVYGGPHYPTVRNRWTKSHQLFDEILAAAGIVVLRVDPRSTTAHGVRHAWSTYRQLGVNELRDLEDTVTWLKSTGWADPARIGLSGHSYGGFLTAFALTHSRSFAAGIAGAPVTDWRNYDTIYTERYMDTPDANPTGYDKSSVVNAAGNLHGRLLLLHGMTDDNVHLQNTTQLVDALQRADRDFELMLYPRARHGLHGAHYVRTQYDFIIKTMRPDLSPSPPHN